MLRHLIATTLIACAAHGACAADAGRIIFTAGKASVGEQPALEGTAVQEGQLLATGGDGYIYIKTVDNGLFILRPGSRARIATYRVDKANPANTQVKFELLNGVARSKSGDAVKQARQNFRFNTPVAAIGVRGTDFTVFTDNETSRVAVLTGGVVVSGFGGACRPDGGGPCEGAASRELFAAQRGQLLQVTRTQTAPQLLNGSPLSPDLVSPPRTDEPVAKTDGTAGGGASVAQPNLEVKKVAALNTIADPAKPNTPTPSTPVGETPPPLPSLPPPVTPVPGQPERGIIWGRWVPSDAYYAKIDLETAMSKGELISLNGEYALVRTAGRDYVAPSNGSLGFSLSDSEAAVVTDYGYGGRTVEQAKVTNGALNVNFGSRSFETNLNIVSKGDTMPFQAKGTVGADGRLYGDAANGAAGLMNVQGVLSNDKGGTAAYIFDGRIDTLRTVNGGTSWRQQ
jgi:hypothetical protein